VATLKLNKKKPPPRGTEPAAPRAPLRGAGARPRPTLGEAQQQRADRALPPRARRAPADIAPPRRHEAPAPARRHEATAPPPRRRDMPLPSRGAPPAAPLRPRETPATQQAEQGVRLSKRMSELGLASRREADEWIAHGYVRVDGRVVSELGSRVLPQQHISVAPEATQQQAQRVTVLINKPIGYVSGQAEDGYEPAVVLVTPANRWAGDRAASLRFSPAHLRHLAPAGRLDIDSVGLLVLTQDGRIAKQLIGERSDIEKEYLVRVQWADPERARTEFGEGPPMHTFPAERLERLRHGLALDGEALKPAKVSWQNEEQLRFALREGKKRQIRRMCELVGLAVTGLKRVRIGRVVLGDLPPGQWRYLGPFERF
jgi:23S rRNA pseudouridine2604 synthase